MNDPQNDVFRSGEFFHGYVVEQLLGKGGLGAVYLVRHKILNTVYALKILYPEVVRQNADYVTRFLREAKIATRIRHPNLVAVYDCGFDEERKLYFLVMDYVSGGDLRQAMAFLGRFEQDRAVDVVLQVASALEEAHRHRVVHRDIKPENIMLQPNGLVKLVDLGIAKSDEIKDSLNTTTAAVFGTPAYVAPEQALDASAVDVRSDIYSLGVVFFEMLVGRPPFQGTSAPQILMQILSEDPFPDIRDFMPCVNPMLAVLIRRMCVKERDRRIAGPSELIAEFAKLGYRLARPELTHPGYLPIPEIAQPTRSVKDILVNLPEKPNQSNLFDAVDDAEIRTFMQKRSRRARVRQFCVWALPFVLFLLLLAFIYLLLR